MTLESGTKRTAKRRYLVWGLVLLVAGVAVLLLLPILTSVSIRTRSSKALNQAKQLGLACRLYAGDHGGSFPVALHALPPEYVPEDYFEGLFQMRLDEKGDLAEFLYFAGLREDDPPDLPLIASAIVGTKGERSKGRELGKRILLLVDQSAAIVREEDYQAAVERYREWVRKREDGR